MRNFKGIWINASLYINDDLSPKEKILLLEIDSLDNGERGCFANNAYFAKILQISISQASRLIGSLVKNNLIKSIVSVEKGRNNERRIHLTQPISILFPEQNKDDSAFRNFRGIWIPAALYLAPALSPTQKILLVEIDSLAIGQRGCFASNAYFAKFLKMGVSQASRLINGLIKCGLVYVETWANSGKGTERRLFLTQPISVAFPEQDFNSETAEGIRKSAEGVSAKVRKGYTQKCGGGIRKNADHNKPVNKTVLCTRQK